MKNKLGAFEGELILLIAAILSNGANFTFEVN
jgi:hypothetical protein